LTEEKKVSRRRYLELTGAGIAGLVVGGALGYVAQPTVTAPAVTVTAPAVTSTVTETVTGTTQPPTTPVLTVDEAAAIVGADMQDLGLTVSDFAKQAQIKWDQYSGTKLRMISIAETQPYMNALQGPFAATFKDLTGIDVSFEWYDGSQMLQKILADFTSKAGIYDILCLQSYGTMTQYVEKMNGITPLDDYLNNSKLTDLNWFDLGDFYPNLLEGTRYKGKTYAMADEWETTWTYYRKDIFDKYGVTKLPDNFDELYDAAKACTHPPDIYGIASRGLPSIDENIFTFCSFLFGYGGDWLDEAWKPVLNSDAGVAALEMYAKLLRDCGPPGIASWGWEDERLFSMQGKAAINSPASNWRAMPYWSKNIGECKVPGKMWFLPMQQGPAGYRVSPLFLHQHSISNFSKHKEAAWLWLQFMHSKPVMTVAAYGDMAWTRKSSYQVPAVKQLTGLMDNYDKFIPYASETTYPYAFTVPIPEWPEVGDAAARAVSSAIAGEKTAKDALDEAAVKIQSILEKAGYYKPGVAPYTHPPPKKIQVQY
jgi:multiple sugar transport system substrate-binding protein